MSYNLVVLGGGPAGYAGAIRASKLGMKVALVEKDNVGGTCLNRGCIPTKALLHSANIYYDSQDFESIGINIDSISFDENKIYEHKDEIVTNLRNGILSLVKAGNIDYFNGFGKLTDKNKVQVNDEVLETENILIATGSSPAQIKIPGIENAYNSDSILEKPLNADNIVIIGGGVIGMEFASYYSSLKKQVTVVEAMDRILSTMSKEISVQLGSVLKKKGVNVIAGASVIEINKDGVKISKAGVESEIKAEAVIVAIGRKSNISGIGLEEVGVETNGRFIIVDDNLETNVKGIYAAGDCIGKVQLAHYATASALYAVDSMLGRKHSVDLSTVPSCVYTSPEVASVGQVEFENAKVGKFLLGANGKSLINGSNRGFVKIAADEDGIVKGGELFGCGVAELVGEVALAVKNKLTVEDISSTIHAHPTVYEAIGEAAEDIFGLATHKR